MRRRGRRAAAESEPAAAAKLVPSTGDGFSGVHHRYAIGWVLVCLLFRSGLPAETDMSTIVISVLILAVVWA